MKLYIYYKNGAESEYDNVQRVKIMKYNNKNALYIYKSDTMFTITIYLNEIKIATMYDKTTAVELFRYEK